MRWDRFISLNLIRPAVRAGWYRSIPGTPVLMYHSVTPESEAGVSGYYKVTIQPARFREQMKLLAEAGRMAISLEEARKLEPIPFGSPPDKAAEKEPIGPRQAVVITFDDGFRDFLDHGWPVLKQHGFGATVFLPTAYIGNQPQMFQSRPCLTWSEIRALRREGVHFGSHTVNHPRLYDLSWPKIEYEVRQSKETIEAELGEKISTFAYPYAFPFVDEAYVRKLEELLRSAGIGACATTRIGRMAETPTPFFIDRLPANDDDDPEFFLAKLEGAYDWLQKPQTAFKRFTGRKREEALSANGTG